MKRLFPKDRCTCLKNLPPKHWGYRPRPPCPIHLKKRTIPPNPPGGNGGGSR